MIRRLYVNNYKCLVNFELQLRELSLLLGPSGVGKTAVFDIMFALRRLLSGDARVTNADAFPTRTLTRWQDHDLQVFEIEVYLESEIFTYRLEVEHERASKRARIAVEKLAVGGNPLFESVRGIVQLYRDDHSAGPKYQTDWSESSLARVAPTDHNKRLTAFLEYMRKILVCGLSPPTFVTESDTESPLLARDASNFSDWFRHALQEHPDLFPEFTNTLKQAIGAGMQGIRLEKTGSEARALMVAFAGHDTVDSRRSYELRFGEMSDGERALVALYGLIHLTRGQGYTLFLDEPDNYVALPELQPWLMSLEDVCGDAVQQAVLASHHPELIDYLGSENGVLLRRETSGVVTTRRPEVSAGDAGLKLSELIARGWEQ